MQTATGIRLQAAGRLQARAVIRPSCSTRCMLVRAAASAEYEGLQGLKVVSAATGLEVELTSLWQPTSGKTVVLPFLSHCADLTSWELGQKLLQKVLPLMKQQNVQVITVCLGSVDNALGFAATLNYPIEGLFADPTGACYKALQFSPGFAPGANISPYLKLLPMLAGIGSPGTLQEVIRGYVGDRSAGPVFDRSSPFDILGTGYQRPFELATLRLFNMVGILPKWGELSPPDTSLLVQQGGTLVFKGEATVFRHDDEGILKYTNVDDLLAAVASAEAGASSSSQVLSGVSASSQQQD